MTRPKRFLRRRSASPNARTRNCSNCGLQRTWPACGIHSKNTKKRAHSSRQSTVGLLKDSILWTLEMPERCFTNSKRRFSQSASDYTAFNFCAFGRNQGDLIGVSAKRACTLTRSAGGPKLPIREVRHLVSYRGYSGLRSRDRGRESDRCRHP